MPRTATTSIASRATETQNRPSRLPTVAIVGRPNVGKSALFNRIIKNRKSIVEDIPGVTRDRVYGTAKWKGQEFSIVDTGGLVFHADEEFKQSEILEQIQAAVSEADLLIFVLDHKTGPLPDDKEILNYLRKTGKPVIYVVNKVDHDSHISDTFEFHSLGIDNLLNVSALHNRNIYELMEEIATALPAYQSIEETTNETIRISVVGQPNVGKSTLVNQILGEKRVVTSPQPGTTRDAIDSHFQYEGNDYIIIDTAGIRKKSKVKESVERYSVLRAIKAIERSDVVLLMIDGAKGPTHQDGHLSQIIKEKGKASIILINKWDLAPDDVKHKGDDIANLTKEKLPEINYSPVITVSALTGLRVSRIIELVKKVYENHSRKIPTKQLNLFLKEIKKIRSIPSLKGKELKFYYMSQIKASPPTFVIFTNAKEKPPSHYIRFIENRLREKFDFEGTPIRIIFRTREKAA